MSSSSLLKKVSTCVIAGLTTIALLLVLGNSGTLNWFPPVVVFSLVGIAFFGSLIFPFVWHRQEKYNRIDSEKVYAFLHGIIRYTIAFNLSCFGWKKLLGLQFVVPTEISDKPMNQQTGEWLTWYYFGYSFAFGIILSIIQIGGSYLLLFRKTLLLGTVVLFPFMLHLTLINIFYQLNTGALLQSLLLTTGIAYLLLQHYHILVAFFLKTTSGLPAFTLSSFAKRLLRFSVILLSLAFTVYLKYQIK